MDSQHVDDWRKRLVPHGSPAEIKRRNHLQCSHDGRCPMLNAACGNKTALALTEAEKNFTMGIVAQFTTEGLPVGIEAGPLVIVNVAIICVIFSVVWVFSG
jgi:hypothetical protein